jgi:pimeloyl-ACP methyl ester carboxylesterase
MEGIWAASKTLFADRQTEAELMMKLQFSERFLSSKPHDGGGKTNRELLIEDFFNKRKSEGIPSIRGLVGQLSAVSRHYISRERLRYLKRVMTANNAPILLMTGTKDKLVRPINSFILKEIMDVRLLVFEGAGHMIHIECSQSFNHLLQRHFQNSVVDGAAL